MVVFDYLMPVFAFKMNFVVRNIIFKNNYVMKHNILTVSYFSAYIFYYQINVMFVCVVQVISFRRFQRTVGEGVVKWLSVAFFGALKEAKNTLVKNCIGKKVLINIKHKIFMEQTIFLASKCHFVCDNLVFLEILKLICASYLNCNRN